MDSHQYKNRVISVIGSVYYETSLIYHLRETIILTCLNIVAIGAPPIIFTLSAFEITGGVMPS